MAPVMNRLPRFIPAFAAGARRAAFGALAVAGLFGAAIASLAQDWPHWRGPTFNGAAPDQPVPKTFSRTEGVAWTAPMPGDAGASPVVIGDRVLISSTDAADRSIVALCLDRKTGKEVWRHKIADGDRRDNRSNFASPSPTSDGRLAWFFYGQGDLVAFTLDGQEVWRRNIQKDHGPFAFNWTFSSSPLLFEGRLYLQVLQRDVPVQGRGRTDGPNDPYLLAMDPATGKDLWRKVRPSEAREESRESFASIVPYVHEGHSLLLAVGGDCLTGHDAATGDELWRWGTWNPTRITHWRLVPSSVGGAGVALACGPKGSPVYAVKAGSKGTLPDDGYAWKSEDRELSSDVSTPLFYRGRFYVVNSDRRMILAVQPSDGKVLWKGELPGRSKIEASPVAADGRIHLINHTGEVYVVGTGDQFELLHQAAMGGEEDREVRASIAIAHGTLFVRTTKLLYAIGPKS